MAEAKVKINDRVKRVNGNGCHGVVKEIKTEVTATTADAREKGLMATVLWDDGTFSYFAPESLQVIDAK